jgi:hypothetical protein
MGSLKHFSLVVALTTLGNFFYRQIKVAIIKKSVFKNIFGNMHDNVTKMVSTPMF